MREHPDTPFPLPPLGAPCTPFPDSAPWDEPIWKLPWWLSIKCDCGGGVHYPLRLMSAQIGWRLTLRQVVARLRCKMCGGRPSSVVLVDGLGGDTGRYGSKDKKLTLVGLKQ